MPGGGIAGSVVALFVHLRNRQPVFHDGGTNPPSPPCMGMPASPYPPDTCCGLCDGHPYWADGISLSFWSLILLNMLTALGPSGWGRETWCVCPADRCGLIGAGDLGRLWGAQLGGPCG